MSDDVVFDPPPRNCPNPRCRVCLNKAYPQCPACQEPLAPGLSKDRAETAVERGLGLGTVPLPVPLCLAIWVAGALGLWALGFGLVL